MTGAHAPNELGRLLGHRAETRKILDDELCPEACSRAHRAPYRHNPAGRVRISRSLLQEARAKLARQQVQSERPGLPAGAFAFCGVRTAFCDKGLRARRSLRVGQRRGALGALAYRRGDLGGLSLRASDELEGLPVSGSVFPRRADTNA